MQASWHSMGPSAIEIVRPAARALLTFIACLFQPTLGEVEHKNELAVRALVEAEV